MKRALGLGDCVKECTLRVGAFVSNGETGSKLMSGVSGVNTRAEARSSKEGEFAVPARRYATTSMLFHLKRARNEQIEWLRTHSQRLQHIRR
jgi:hypothetical protein